MSVERSEFDVGRSAPKGAVFLSYAREDADAAKHIAEALRAFGIEVWFDQNELRGGDAWDQQIRTQIKTCALFVPLVSGRTEERTEGYFRREWKLAIDRTHDMAGGRSFIVPVVIDETSEGGAVPEEFMRYQWTRLANGAPTPEFVAQVKRLLEAPKTGKKPAMAAQPRPPTLPPQFRQAAELKEAAAVAAAAGSKSRLPLILGVVAALAVAAAVFFALRPAEKEAPVAAPVAAVPPVIKPAAPAVDDKSVAVLPFENMSEDKDNIFFVDGIQEDILTNLALVRALRVVSRTSVMQYRGTTKTIRQIAQELGVAYILEGSVQRAGNKVRVTGQLIKAATDEHVWAKSYDRDLTDIFSIQSELSQAIATALSAALSPQEKQLLDRRPTDNLAAYDAYLKARKIRQDNNLGPHMVEPLLEEAVRLDPNFAIAWGELASVMSQAYFNDVDHSPAQLAKIKAAIDTAVQLAPDDPDVIERLGDYYYYANRDFTKASEQYQRLAVLRPNDAAVFGSLGFIHRREGKWAEALPELRRATELEPRDLRYGFTLAEVLVALRHYDEAAVVEEHILAQFPDSSLDRLQQMTIPLLARGSVREGTDFLAALPAGVKDQPLMINARKQWARATGDWAEAGRLDRRQRYFDDYGESHWSQDISAAYVLWMQGDKATARTLIAQAVIQGKEELAQKPSPTTLITLAGAYALLGDKAEALRCGQAAKDLIPESKDAVAGPPISANYAQVLAWVGEKDQALAELARLLRVPYGENIHSAQLNPGWLPLWDDPRFKALVNDPKNNAPLF